MAANITSLSVQAKEYLFDKENTTKLSVLMLNEIHKQHSIEVTSQFHRGGYNSYYNPSTFNPTTQGTHGGELVAIKKNLNSKNLEPSLLEVIAEESQHPLAFSASYLRLKGLTILLCTVYLFCTEGMSERNNAIMFQLSILRNLVGIPMLRGLVAVGDCSRRSLDPALIRFMKTEVHIY